MKRIEDNDQRQHLLNAQDDIGRLLRIVIEETEITPIKRRAIRKALDSMANLEECLYGVSVMPLSIIERECFKPYLSPIDRS